MEDRGLLNKINKTRDEIEADRSAVKIIILAIVGIIFSFFFGYFLKFFILQGRLDFLLFCFLAALGFLVIFLLQVFFIKALRIVNLIIFLETASFLASFYSYLSNILTLGALLAFLFFLSGAYSGRQELENMLKIKFWPINKKVLPKAFAGLALFSSIAYIIIIDLSGNKFFISEKVFEQMFKFVPGIDFSLPVETLIRNQVFRQIQDSEQFKLLPQWAKTQAINQGVKEFQQTISDITGVPLNPKLKASEVMYQIAAKKFAEIPERIKSLIPPTVALLIFLTIISLSLPIRLVVTFIAFIVYETCLAVGFADIMLEGRNREIIVLK